LILGCSRALGGAPPPRSARRASASARSPRIVWICRRQDLRMPPREIQGEIITPHHGDGGPDASHIALPIAIPMWPLFNGIPSTAEAGGICCSGHDGHF
jgi:hypothetical protein